MSRTTLLLAGLLLFGCFASGPVGYSSLEAQCVWCTGPTTCEPSETSGDATSCEYKNSACNNVGICVVAVAQLQRDLKTQPAKLRRIETDQGVLTLANVEGSHFAAWTCDGHLLYIADIQADGRMRKMPVGEYRERLQYDRVVAASQERISS
jgi:hypothetical protein